MGASTRMEIEWFKQLPTFLSSCAASGNSSTVSILVGVSGLAPWEFQFSCAPPCLMGDTNNLKKRNKSGFPCQNVWNKKAFPW